MKLKYFILVIVATSLVKQVNAQFGSLDLSFYGSGKVTTDFNNVADGGTAVVIQPDGKIITVGYTPANNSYAYALTRHNEDGTLDTSFGGTGKVITDFATGYDYAATVLVQPDGKIVAAGTKFSAGHQDNSLIRYNSDGTLDITFGVGGKVQNSVGVADGGINSIKLQADGKIVASGISTNSSFSRDFAITRYNTNGTLDATFGTGGIVMFDFNNSYDFPFAMEIQTDGKIIVGGSTGQDPVYDFGMIRLDTLGAIDPTFGTGGMAITDFGRPDEWANALTIQPDGKIIQCGYSGSPYQIALARFLDDGTPDTTFNTTGKVLTSVSTHAEGNAIALQTDGKIVVAGEAWIGSNHEFCIVRYNIDGLADTTFGTNGSVTTDFGTNGDKAKGVAIQTDGKIVAVGGTSIDFAIARYLVTLPTGLIDFSSMNQDVFIFPNPVGNQATLSYALDEPENITIRLFDINGKLVKTLIDDQFRSAAEHFENITFPDGMTSGVYFINMSGEVSNRNIKVIRY